MGNKKALSLSLRVSLGCLVSHSFFGLVSSCGVKGLPEHPRKEPVIFMRHQDPRTQEVPSSPPQSSPFVPPSLPSKLDSKSGSGRQIR